MARHLALLAAVLGLSAISCGMIIADQERLRPGPVYSLAFLNHQVRAYPARWLQRTVWVRAVAQWCAADTTPRDMPVGDWCVLHTPILVDATDVASPALPLVQRHMARPVPSLPTLLRRLLILGHWLPQPQMPQWGQVAVYRVQLRADQVISCFAPPCFQAVLLDD